MKTIDIIHDEHRALAAILQALNFIMDEISAGRREPDFKLLAMMVDYITQAPDKIHHPKEDKVLFPLVRQCSPEAIPLLDKLEEDHRLGYKKTVELLQALIHYQSVGAPGFSALYELTKAYLEFNWQHLNEEEGLLLPLARRDLSAEDWASIDAEFAKNFDPFSGAEGEFGELFRLIVNLTPAPYGLG
jgi:branched-chain amino acid transport system ATP-binding protein